MDRLRRLITLNFPSRKSDQTEQFPSISCYKNRSCKSHQHYHQNYFCFTSGGYLLSPAIRQMKNYFNLNYTSPTHKLLKAKMFKTYRITSLRKHWLRTSCNNICCFRGWVTTVTKRLMSMCKWIYCLWGHLTVLLRYQSYWSDQRIQNMIMIRDDPNCGNTGTRYEPITRPKNPDVSPEYKRRLSVTKWTK